MGWTYDEAEDLEIYGAVYDENPACFYGEDCPICRPTRAEWERERRAIMEERRKRQKGEESSRRPD